MKKLYVLLIALISVSALVAQDRGRNSIQKDNYSQQQPQRNSNKQNENYKDRGYSNNDHYYNHKQQQMQENDRRVAIDRINRDYDQRISRYRNDRSMNSYERDRRIVQLQKERQQQVSSFGKGAIAGAIVGLIAGALFSQ